jgi:hypothetical protein
MKIRLYDQEGNLHVMRVPDTASNRLFGQYLDAHDHYPFKERHKEPPK